MAAVQLTVAAFDAMMKEVYVDGRTESLAKKNRPLLEWIPRKDDFYGDALVSPVLHEDPQSAGVASLKHVIEQAETTKQTKFVLTADDCIELFGAVQVTAKAIRLSAKDTGAFIRAKKAQIDGMLRRIGKALHLALYRSGSGSIGEISNVATASPSAGKTTLTLSNPSDVYNFGIGQSLVTSADDGGGVVIENLVSTVATIVKVESIQHGAGTIVVDIDTSTLDTPWTTSTEWLFHGDSTGTALHTNTNYDNLQTGLAGWIPLTAPTGSDSFFSVNRSLNEAPLSGYRLDKSGRTMLENVNELSMLVGEGEGEPDTLFVNPRAGKQLAAQAGAEVERRDGGKARMGFSGFTLVGFMGPPVDVIFDIGCPPDRAYLLQKDTWVYSHNGAVPHIIRDDGNESLRSTTGAYDGVEIRSRAYGNLRCKCPGFNGVMSVATS